MPPLVVPMFSDPVPSLLKGEPAASTPQQLHSSQLLSTQPRGCQEDRGAGKTVSRGALRLEEGEGRVEAGLKERRGWKEGRQVSRQTRQTDRQTNGERQECQAGRLRSFSDLRAPALKLPFLPDAGLSDVRARRWLGPCLVFCS